MTPTPRQLKSCHLHDMFVHRDLWPGVTTSARVYGTLRGEFFDQALRQDTDILPIRVESDITPRLAGDAATADVPGYLGMLEWACARVGWRLDEFRLYRSRLAFPVVPSTLVRTVTLPLEPA